MNRNGAKHPNQANEVLYLNKGMGGRGLKNLKQPYKETKIKSGDQDFGRQESSSKTG